MKDIKKVDPVILATKDYSLVDKLVKEYPRRMHCEFDIVKDNEYYAITITHSFLKDNNSREESFWRGHLLGWCQAIGL